MEDEQLDAIAHLAECGPALFCRAFAARYAVTEAAGVPLGHDEALAWWRAGARVFADPPAG